MRIRAAFLNRLLAGCVVCLVRLLFCTVRIRFRESDPSTNPYTGCGPAVIYSVWHDVMIYSIFGGRHARTVALVSQHQDGSLLARCLELLGIGLVRGSSSRSAAGALREMIRLPADRNIVLTPDGPRGPEHQTKPGMTLLAARTGRPVVASGFAAVRYWKIPGSWTDFEIPMPFTTVYFLTGKRLEVEAHASRETLENMEAEIQRDMDQLTREARRLACEARSGAASSRVTALSSAPASREPASQETAQTTELATLQRGSTGESTVPARPHFARSGATESRHRFGPV